MKKSEQLEVVGQLRFNECGELHTVQKVRDRRYRFRYIMGCPKAKCGILFTQEAFDYAKQHNYYSEVKSLAEPNAFLTLTIGSEGENTK